MDYVRVPKNDWQDILDATRSKTGGTEKMVSGEVAAAIAGIVAGGGQQNPFVVSTTDAMSAADYFKAIANEKVGELPIASICFVKKDIPDESTPTNAFVFICGDIGSVVRMSSTLSRWRDGTYNSCPTTSTVYDCIINPGDKFYKIIVSPYVAE